MKQLDEAERKALMSAILELTGGKSVFVVVSDSEMPCEEEKNNLPCTGHFVQQFCGGMANECLIHTLLATIDELRACIKNEKNDGSVPSPFASI